MPVPGARARGDRVGRRDERIRAVVDVQQRRLAGLHQHRLALVQRLVQQQARVGDHRPRGGRRTRAARPAPRGSRPRAGCTPSPAAGSSAPARRSTFCSRIFSSYRSWTRMPIRFILSAYVGPMPRPVVPIWRLPRNRSVTLSRVRLYGGMTWALALTTSRDVSTPRACERVELLEQHARGRPRPRCRSPGCTPGVRMPLGSRCSAYFSVADHDRVAGVVAAVELHHVVDTRPCCRADRSPCLCPHRPTGRRRARLRASQPSSSRAGSEASHPVAADAGNGEARRRSPDIHPATHPGSCDQSLPDRSRRFGPVHKAER